MSTVRRIAELYETTMNAVLDRVANPRELADYSYTQLRELLAEVQRDTVQVAAAASMPSGGSVSCGAPRTGSASRRNRR